MPDSVAGRLGLRDIRRDPVLIDVRGVDGTGICRPDQLFEQLTVGHGGLAGPTLSSSGWTDVAIARHRAFGHDGRLVKKNLTIGEVHGTPVLVAPA
jgi:hypothetical protein